MPKLDNMNEKLSGIWSSGNSPEEMAEVFVEENPAFAPVKEQVLKYFVHKDKELDAHFFLYSFNENFIDEHGNNVCSACGTVALSEELDRASEFLGHREYFCARCALIEWHESSREAWQAAKCGGDTEEVERLEKKWYEWKEIVDSLEGENDNNS